MHITRTGETYRYDYPAIEAALVVLGATAQEADTLTDILHMEGWGGIEETATRDFTSAELSSMLDWMREHRPVDPRADWDDSHYIDIIEAAKLEWAAESPCTTATDDDTDAHINRQLFDGSPVALRNLSDELRNVSAADIRDSVKAGMSNWYGNVDTGAVEHYDSLGQDARREYRESTMVGDARRDSDCISVATAEQLDAIDAGHKPPCLS